MTWLKLKILLAPIFNEVMILNNIYRIFFMFLFCIFSFQLRAELLTLDSHIDIPFDYMINPEHDPGNMTEMQVDFQKMIKGNLDGGFFVVYVGQSESVSYTHLTLPTKA